MKHGSTLKTWMDFLGASGLPDARDLSRVQTRKLLNQFEKFLRAKFDADTLKLLSYRIAHPPKKLPRIQRWLLRTDEFGAFVKANFCLAEKMADNKGLTKKTRERFLEKFLATSFIKESKNLLLKQRQYMFEVSLSTLGRWCDEFQVFDYVAPFRVFPRALRKSAPSAKSAVEKSEARHV